MFKRMYLEITNVCNLRCAFCPGTQRPRRFMTPEEFRQLATRLRSCWISPGSWAFGCAL